MQERHNSSAFAMELHLYCTIPLSCEMPLHRICIFDWCIPFLCKIQHCTSQLPNQTDDCKILKQHFVILIALMRSDSAEFLFAQNRHQALFQLMCLHKIFMEKTGRRKVSLASVYNNNLVCFWRITILQNLLETKIFNLMILYLIFQMYLCNDTWYNTQWW